jgi:preprotein translocase subunit SecG
MMTIVTIVFFAVFFGLALYINNLLDKREEEKNKKAELNRNTRDY